MSLPRNFSAYSVNELGTVAQRVDGVVAPLNLPVYDDFNVALIAYKASLVKNKSSAKNVIHTDYLRDNSYRGLYKMVDAYTCSNDITIATIAKTVDDIINKYGRYSVSTKKYKEQTTITNRVIAEIEKLPAEDLEKIHLIEWLTVLKEENTAFETVLSAYLDDNVTNSEVLSATENRMALEKAMQTIIEYVELMVKIASTPSLDTCYKQLAEVLNR